MREEVRVKMREGGRMSKMREGVREEGEDIGWVWVWCSGEMQKK